MSVLPFFTIDESKTPEELANLEPLNGAEQVLLSAVEQRFWAKKVLPSIAQMKAVFANSAAATDWIDTAWEKPAFQQALRSKGLILDSPVEGVLTPKQLLAINVVLTRQDKRSLREKLKSVGVTVTQWQNWLANRAFFDYLQAKSGVDFNSADSTAFKTILDAVEDGDLTATKLYLELRGIYTNKVQVELNAGLLIQQISEIVLKYVPEEHLSVVADEIERLTSAHLGSSNSLERNTPPAVVGI